MEKDTAISTLNDYLTWVKEKRFVPVKLDALDAFPLVDDLRKNLYFRGQSDETWMITPALYRYRFESEYEWLKMAAMRTWQETSHLSNLNKLITFQHYGLKTRLLDVTRNPLVALYFACLSSQEKQETDGAVYYGYNDKDNSLSAECLADILFFFGYSQGDTYSMKEVKTKVRDRNVVAKEYLPDLREILCLPHFIKAPMNNPRISAQQGAFIMAPFLTERPGEKGKEKNVYWVHPQYEFERSNQKETDVFFKEDRAIIPANKKEDILRELDDVGINPATLFRDMEHTLNAVNEEMITGKRK